MSQYHYYHISPLVATQGTIFGTIIQLSDRTHLCAENGVSLSVAPSGRNCAVRIVLKSAPSSHIPRKSGTGGLHNRKASSVRLCKQSESWATPLRPRQIRCCRLKTKPSLKCGLGQVFEQLVQSHYGSGVRPTARRSQRNLTITFFAPRKCGPHLPSRSQGCTMGAINRGPSPCRHGTDARAQTC